MNTEKKRQLRKQLMNPERPRKLLEGFQEGDFGEVPGIPPERLGWLELGLEAPTEHEAGLLLKKFGGTYRYGLGGW